MYSKMMEDLSDLKIKMNGKIGQERDEMDKEKEILNLSNKIMRFANVRIIKRAPKKLKLIFIRLSVYDLKKRFKSAMREKKVKIKKVRGRLYELLREETGEQLVDKKKNKCNEVQKKIVRREKSD